MNLDETRELAKAHQRIAALELQVAELERQVAFADWNGKVSAIIEIAETCKRSGVPALIRFAEQLLASAEARLKEVQAQKAAETGR